MLKFHLKAVFAFLAYLLVCPALALAEPVDNNSTATHGYRLVTPPSSNKEEAELMLGVIRAEIPKAEVKKLIERRVFYRLVAGRYDDMTSAVRLRSDLLKRNISSIIMQSKNRFSVVVSSHISEKLALDEQKQLVSKHINSSIVKFNLSSAYWQINSVDAYNLRDAVYTATIMATNDVITTIE